MNTLSCYRICHSNQSEMLPIFLHVTPSAVHSPLSSEADLPLGSHRFSRPVSPKLNELQVFQRQINAQTRGFLHGDVALALIGDVDAPYNGVIFGKDGVGKIDRDGAVVVKERDNQSRDVIVGSERRGKARQTRFSRSDSVGSVSKIANGVSLGLVNLHRGNPEVSSAKVGVLPSDSTNHVNPTIDRRRKHFHALRRRAAEVVGEKVASQFVHVEAIRRAFAVEGKRRAINNNAFEVVSLIQHLDGEILSPFADEDTFWAKEAPARADTEAATATCLSRDVPIILSEAER